MPETDAVFDANMPNDQDLDDLAFDLEILDEPAISSKPIMKKGGPQKVPPSAEAAQKRPYPPGAPLKPAPQGAPKLGGKPANGGTREDVPPLPKRRVSPQVPPGDAEAHRMEAPTKDSAREIDMVSSPQEAAPASSKPEPRPEIKVPSVSRLEEMRVRSGGVSGPSSPPPSAPSGKAAKGQNKQRRPGPPVTPGPAKKQAARGSAPPTPGQVRRQRRQNWMEVYAGRLIENVPRKMRVATAERVEVRISREETDAITKGFDGRGEVVHHEVLVSQAMSVMLRAPDGGFIIEALSPETQWTSDGSDHRTRERFGRWRWAVTPKTAGDHRLQLIVAARSVDENGMTGDTALPDQVIDVRVNANYMLSFKRALAWFVVMALGGVITELAVRTMKIFDN
jgi:hypothetical protein